MHFTINTVYHILILVSYVLTLAGIFYFVEGKIRGKK